MMTDPWTPDPSIPEDEPVKPPFEVEKRDFEIEEAAPVRSLDYHVRSVANQRQALEDLESVWREKQQAFADSNADIVSRIGDLKKQVTEGEKELKALALSRHHETGELKLAPGVKIRRQVQVGYDESDAIAWCKAHDEAAECLKLDKTKFNSLAKSLKLHFVTKETVSQVTLAKDLKAALEEE